MIIFDSDDNVSSHMIIHAVSAKGSRGETCMHIKVNDSFKGIVQ